jgi:4-amino-4-deoxy-L-arabinose transferase-like glycosyltransferase
MRRQLTEIIILTLISLILIFYRFNHIPKNLNFDEVEFAKLAFSLDKKSYTPYSPLSTGHSTLYFYTILISFKIFGVNNFALRFPSALFGVLNVLLFYLIIKISIKQYSPEAEQVRFRASNLARSKVGGAMSNVARAIKQWIPLILSFVFLTSRWYFNFARFGFEATFLLFLELFSIYFLLRYLKKPKTSSLILTMFFAGLAFNSYLPGRIFFVLPFVFIISWSIKQWSNRTMKQLIIGLFIFLFTILPLTSYLITHPDIRFQQQFFPTNSGELIHRKIEFLWSNIKSTALMFNIKGDVNGRHNYPFKPALNPILGLFFIGGLIIALKNYKNFYNQFFLLYFVISLIPSLLTYPWENPNMLRTFTVIPSVVFFVGQAFEFLSNTTFVRSFKSGSKKFLIFLILFILLLSSIYEIRTYFKYQAKVFEKAFEVKKGLETLINK